MRIETERLFLRAFSEEDWKDIYEYLSMEEVVRFEPYDPYTEEDCREAAIGRSKNPSFWAVCLKETGKLIGNLYFSKQDPEEFSTWELGYVFNPIYGKKGFATEASRGLMKYAFKELDAHRVIARCNPKNEASWKLLERLEMRREGFFRKGVYFKRDMEGEPIWHDTFFYAILKEEYMERETI